MLLPVSLVVVVVVVFFTLSDRASTIPSNILRGCQSGTWSQRGTKINGSHHGDDPLLRPTGIQIATNIYAALQPMAPTNIKTVHGKKRGGTFHGEMDRCRKNQGWTTACSGIPERDGKNQKEDIPTQEGSCWFARPC